MNILVDGALPRTVLRHHIDTEKRAEPESARETRHVLSRARSRHRAGTGRKRHRTSYPQTPWDLRLYATDSLRQRPTVDARAEGRSVCRPLEFRVQEFIRAYTRQTDQESPIRHSW
eukprot:scaffold14803_cov67-Phaeocystis_antarctica.AAC.2